MYTRCNHFFHLSIPDGSFVNVERRERPIDPSPKPPSPQEEGGGPKRPETDSPGRDNLLKRMRKVDPKQAERYKQRTGE